MLIRMKYFFCAALASAFNPQTYFSQPLCTVFQPWSYFIQYDQHYISITKILNLMSKKTFWEFSKRDKRFLESAIYSYLGMNSNYSLFLQRISASMPGMLIWFKYWNVQSRYFGLACSVLVVYSLIMVSSTITSFGQTSWAFFTTNLFLAYRFPQNIMG